MKEATFICRCKVGECNWAVRFSATALIMKFFFYCKNTAKSFFCCYWFCFVDCFTRLSALDTMCLWGWKLWKKSISFLHLVCQAIATFKLFRQKSDTNLFLCTFTYCGLIFTPFCSVLQNETHAEINRTGEGCVTLPVHTLLSEGCSVLAMEDNNE